MLTCADVCRRSATLQLTHTFHKLCYVRDIAAHPARLEQLRAVERGLSAWRLAETEVCFLLQKFLLYGYKSANSAQILTQKARIQGVSKVEEVVGALEMALQALQASVSVLQLGARVLHVRNKKLSAQMLALEFVADSAAQSVLEGTLRTPPPPTSVTSPARQGVGAQQLQQLQHLALQSAESEVEALACVCAGAHTTRCGPHACNTTAATALSAQTARCGAATAAKASDAQFLRHKRRMLLETAGL
jgi:hypothetical protein